MLRTVTISAATLFSILWFGLLALSLSMSQPAGAATVWEQYCNARYEFCIDYPQGVFEERAVADNGDGITLISTDDGAELRIYGVTNAQELSIQEVQQVLLDERDDRDVTYKAARNNWVVISGFQGAADARSVFYQRLEVSETGDRFSGMELVYPESARATYDSLIKRMSLSLTTPSN